jgi:S-(hydroxymethyl)glutathione dehydrogenase / alcohol dehydrogenase
LIYRHRSLLGYLSFPAAAIDTLSVNFDSTNAKRDIPMYAELCPQGRMSLDDLVSKRISLCEANDGYAALKDGSLTRVVVSSF